MTDDEAQKQKAFTKSLADFVEKNIANNPPLLRMRRLNQALVTEVRRRRAAGEAVEPLGAVADEAGNVSLVAAEGKPEAEMLLRQLRSSATGGAVFAASLCMLVERVPPAGGAPVLFIQLHTEDKTGLALLAGIPADEQQPAAGLIGVKGPAVAGYKKKVAPIIFAPPADAKGP